MKESAYTSYEELPLFLNSELVAVNAGKEMTQTPEMQQPGTKSPFKIPPEQKPAVQYGSPFLYGLLVCRFAPGC